MNDLIDFLSYYNQFTWFNITFMIVDSVAAVVAFFALRKLLRSKEKIVGGVLKFVLILLGIIISPFLYATSLFSTVKKEDTHKAKNEISIDSIKVKRDSLK